MEFGSEVERVAKIGSSIDVSIDPPSIREIHLTEFQRRI